MENLIPMGKHEYLVANYPIQDFTVPKTKERTESQLTVTNKRIVYTQKLTDGKKGGSVYTKRDFDINTVETVNSDFAFKKVYSVGLIVFGAILALVGIIIFLAAESVVGLIPAFVGALIIALAIIFAKKCYSFNLHIRTFGSSETTHIQFGSSSLKPEKEKKPKKKKKKKRFTLLKKLFTPKNQVHNIGLQADSIEAMVAEIGSYVVEFKK